ncbi:MAG TPA: tol-pal system-associated acyl-CoA thioesterase [Holosporales bacterium]|nr:tol-pal system-associated acyl-CoA thioesterase [Holosporales bacterium]
MSDKKIFKHTIRVYIEDTDAAGIVYHPNHIKFFERARTEMLRECGYTKTRLEEEEKLLFVIKTITVDYKAPAFMDDHLEVRTILDDHKPTRFYFSQEIYCSQTLIASAKMTIVCVNKAYRPASLPQSLINKLTGF